MPGFGEPRRSVAEAGRLRAGVGPRASELNVHALHVRPRRHRGAPVELPSHLKISFEQCGLANAGHHRRRQGQRVRPRRAGRRARAAGGGCEDPRVRRHRRGGGASEGRRDHRDSDLRRARRERGRRRVRPQPDADHFDSRRRPVAAGRGGRNMARAFAVI